MKFCFQPTGSLTLVVTGSNPNSSAKAFLSTNQQCINISMQHGHKSHVGSMKMGGWFWVILEMYSGLRTWKHKSANANSCPNSC